MKINEIKNNWALRTSTNIGVSNKREEQVRTVVFQTPIIFYFVNP